MGVDGITLASSTFTIHGQLVELVELVELAKPISLRRSDIHEPLSV